jgi:hypothetical protein
MYNLSKIYKFNGNSPTSTSPSLSSYMPTDNSKYFVYGGIVVLIIAIAIIIYLYTKKSDKKIDKFTTELFTIISSMSGVKCLTPSLIKINSTIQLNNIEVQKIIKEKNPSPDSVTKYNAAYKAYTDAYSKLVDCSVYCPQADISTGNCVCPPSYPIPIQVGDKLYCTNEDCTKVPNATFVPSSSNDPAQNRCDCSAGFSKDPNGGSFCYATSDSDSLNTYSTNINASFANLSRLQPLSVFGTYRNAAGNSVNMISQSDMPTGSTPISNIQTLSSIACADECLKNPSAGSFAYDLSNRTCSLYSVSPTIQAIDLNNGSKVVGTKNMLVPQPLRG